MLLNQNKIFRTSFDEVLFLYYHHQSNFDKILFDCTRAKVHIECRQGLNWTAVEKCEDQKLRTLSVIDDLYEQAWEDFFLDLVIAGRHRNIHLITMKHNLLQQSKQSESIEPNVTQRFLFKLPRDLEQIAVIGRQMGDRNLLMVAYKKAIRAPFVHLLIDLDPHRDSKLKIASMCSGTEPSIFCLSSTQTAKKLKDELSRSLYA